MNARPARLSLSTPALRQILLESLGPGPAFGTLLVRRVAERTRGEVQLHSFRVYQTLRAMVKEGLIEPCEPVMELRAGRVPSYYGLTNRGRTALREARRAA